jgi:hypothetical protein
MAEYQNTLMDIIQRCYNGAKLNPGTPSRRKLSRGLRISILVDGDQIKLQLDREGWPPPSLEEWKTVIRNWPWEVSENTVPTRSYIIGDIPRK